MKSDEKVDWPLKKKANEEGIWILQDFNGALEAKMSSDGWSNDKNTSRIEEGYKRPVFHE